LGISLAALPAWQLIQKQNNAVASQRTIRELGSTGFGQLLRSEKSEGVTAAFAENIGYRSPISSAIAICRSKAGFAVAF
jgi:hypothetical protein